MTTQTTAADLIATELRNARAAWPNNPSLAHGLALVAEEIDEYWELVKVNQQRHDHPAMIRELIQVAAMAHRAYEDAFDGSLSPLCGEVFVSPHDTAWHLRQAMVRLAYCDGTLANGVRYWLRVIVTHATCAIDGLQGGSR
jgi:hypothetical protein